MAADRGQPSDDEAVMRRMHCMSRIDPLRGRLATPRSAQDHRRGGRHRRPGQSRRPRRASRASRAGPPGRGERDHLRRRHRRRRARPAHDRHPGRLYRRLERLRLPGALRPRRDDDPTRARRVVGDFGRRARLHLQPAPGREFPRRRAVQRRRRRHLVQLDR